MMGPVCLMLGQLTETFLRLTCYSMRRATRSGPTTGVGSATSARNSTAGPRYFTEWVALMSACLARCTAAQLAAT